MHTTTVMHTATVIRTTTVIRTANGTPPKALIWHHSAVMVKERLIAKSSKRTKALIGRLLWFWEIKRSDGL